MEVDEFEKYLAAMNVAQFGGDPTPIAMILINRKPTTLAGVYKMLAAGKAVTAAVKSFCRKATSNNLNGDALAKSRSRGGLGRMELDFAVATMEAWSSRRVPDQHYHQIPTEEMPAPSCFLSCLKRYAEADARRLARGRRDNRTFLLLTTRENHRLVKNCRRGPN